MLQKSLPAKQLTPARPNPHFNSTPLFISWKPKHRKEIEPQDHKPQSQPQWQSLIQAEVNINYTVRHIFLSDNSPKLLLRACGGVAV
jgi:hypothetical protein